MPLPSPPPRSFLLLLCACLLSALACRSTPPPPEPPGPLQLPPGLVTSVDHHFGTILGGARALPAGVELPELDPAEALVLDIRILSLERWPSEPLEPLAAHTRIVASPDRDQPIRGATWLAVGSGWYQGEDAQPMWDSWLMGASGRATLAEDFTGALPVGLTCTVSLAASETITDPDNFLREWPDRGPVEKRLALAVERRLTPEGGDEGEALTIALGLADLAPGPDTDEPPTLPPPEGGRPDGDFLQHEWIIPDLLPVIDGGPLLLVAPSPFATGEGRACAIRIELGAALAPRTLAERAGEAEAGDAPSAHAASLQLALLDAHKEAAEVAARERPLSREQLARLELANAFATLRASTGERSQRGPLLFLSSVSAAPLTADLTLIADAATLQAWIERLPEPAAASRGDAAGIGWMLERAAWLSLASRAMNDSLPYELESLVLRHAGEVGRYPSTIEDAARRSTGLAHFQARLLAENKLFLEDSNISARVRAFDWLTRVEAAPANFDPLAPASERKAALAAWTVPADPEASSSDSPR